jgi:RHS repeat-associated protein
VIQAPCFTKKETDFRLDPAAEGASFEQEFAYTPLDDVAQLKYPKCHASFTACANDPAASAPTVSFEYDAGALQRVPGYASALSYHGNGMVATVAHTNGVTETIANDPHLVARPGSISASGPAVSWTTGAYSWDGVGNIKTMGGSWFLYDKVSRLKEAHVKTGPAGTGAEVWQAYSYDGFGNLTGYVGTVGRNLPTDLATNKLNAAAFDDRGNMTAWNGHVYTWTGTDQLERHQIPSFTIPDTGENWYHLYTVDDERLVSVDWKRGAKYLRFRDLDGKILREVKQTIVGSNELWTVERDYIYRGATLLAAETPQGRRHFHPDHLGTPRLITNATGQQVAFHTYYPFGEEATAANQDSERLKFTGHERDFLNPNGAGDDLDAMRARYCSPITGRFLGVDPAGESAKVKQPGSWNRYAYSLNNPLRYRDPDGRFAAAIWFGAVAAAIYATVEVVRSIWDAYETGRTLLDSESSASEKFASAGLFVVGLLGPGGGYGAVGRHVDDLADVSTLTRVAEGVKGSKDAARSAIQGLDLPSAQQAGALSAVRRATTASTIDIFQAGNDIVVNVSRQGVNGQQTIQTVVKADGTKSVVQLGIDKKGVVTHYDPKGGSGQ